MENVVSLSFENILTVTLMCIVGWLVMTFLVGFLSSRAGA